jgi:outer membrane receptor for ferrienterochelin and colicins
MGRLASKGLWVLGLAGVCLVGADARADVASEARFFDDLARKAYERGNYESALESFLEVQVVAPSAAALYNIGVCAELAERSDVAFVHYREYMALPDSDKERRADAESRLAKLGKKLALVQVESDPPGAAVYVDREGLGQNGNTPRTVVTDDGEHQIILQMPGYEPVRLPVIAKRGQTVTVRGTLEPHFGVATVRVTPAKAALEFVRGDRKVSPVMKDGRMSLPVGPYVVRGSAPGFVPGELRIVVSEGSPVDVSLGLKAAPPPKGRLLVTADQNPAQVFVDGVRVAHTPASLPLSVGDHTLEVKNARGKSYKQTVTIRRDAASYIEVNLEGGKK